jgi:hypothetical protein
LGEAPSHARTYVRARWSGWCGIGDDFVMPAVPRCAALLRDGQPCGRTVAVGSAFCVHHTKLLATVDAETMRRGRTPKPRAVKKQKLHVVAEPAVEDSTTAGVVAVENADPATVRPLLAVAAAQNVEQLTASLLEAAGSAVKPVWLTVECAACGERSRIEAPVPDVRARVAAIELLLREGWGLATAEVHAPRMPASVAAVKEMSWDEIQALFAAIYVEEIAAAQRDGSDALVRARVAALSDCERARAAQGALGHRVGAEYRAAVHSPDASRNGRRRS